MYLTAIIIMTSCGGKEQKLPPNNKVLTGKLENGMTYYVRQNHEPKQRASFYIIQNVGALLENEEQNGLAHFLEHMSFQGTEHFPGKSMIQMLERNGVSFGHNINAYTAQNETVYNISSVPTTRESLLDSSLLILHDWSHYLSLEAEEIDAERGVITEEWRTRRTPSFRIKMQLNPIIYKGSQYAIRDVIGSLDVIQHFDHQAIRDFYHDWYRTDLQAIAVVGDIDPEKMVAKIKKMFSKIPAVENPKPRPEFMIPEHDEMYFVCATDKEINGSSVQLLTIIPDPKTDKNTYSYLHDGILTSFFNFMINARLGEIMQQSNPPYLGGSIIFGDLVRNYSAYSCSANAKPNEETEALKTILTENERIKKYGFSETELERAKAEYLAQIESSYKQRNKFSNEGFVQSIKSNFLEGEPMVEYEDYYEYAKKVIPAITNKEIMEHAKPWFTKKNQILIVTGPDNVTHLTEDEARGIINYVETDNSILPFEDEFIGQDLISEDLKGCKIVSSKKLEQFDAEEWTLENGVKVVYRKADYEKDVVSFYGYSEGGTSLYDVKDLPSAENASVFISANGVGEFSALTLSKALAGKMVSCSLKIGYNEETVTASATPQDIETMFKLVYLRFNHARKDDEKFQSILNQNLANIDNIEKNPNKIMQDSIDRITSSYSPRTQILSREYLESIDNDRMFEIYNERFANAADFTFFLVGNIEKDVVKPLIEKYLGSLKTSNERETWRDNKVRAPKGLFKREIEVALTTPKSLVVTAFRKEMDYNLHDVYCNNVLRGILDLRYIENIREKEGGTYGVRVSDGSVKEPYPQYSMTMNFDCDPIKANHLKDLIYAEIEKIKKEGVTKEEVSKITLNMLKNFEQSKSHNSYWMNVIANYYITDIDNNDPKNYEDILKNLTPEDIQKFACKLFDNPDTIDLIFKPKK